MTSTLIYLIFFLSGAAGLIYEISWLRQIGLLFGHTIHAASLVLASYFSGMAIGYWLGARWTGRISPLVGYAIAELIVAVWAFIVPALLVFSESATFAPWLSGSSFVWQTVARAVFSFLLLLPATIAIGITLPMIAEFFSGSDNRVSYERDASTRISWAYALNTAGALTGVVLTTFWLLLHVGVRQSSYLAAALSIICALGAIALTSTTKNDSPGSKVQKAAINTGNRTFTLDAQLVALSFLSGFGTLSLQVLYTRMFSLVFHNSTYTFGIVVAVFLASLSFGAALASQLQKWFHCRILVGITAAVGSVAISTSIVAFVRLTELKYFSYGDTFAEYMGAAIAIVTVIVAPAIICLGMLLPLVWKLAGLESDAGQRVGTLTAVNTVAAALGALIASFLMLPIIGLWQSIVLIAILFCFAGCWLLWNENRSNTALLFGIVLSVISVPAINSPIESEYNRTEYGERLIKRWNSAYGWIDIVQREETGAFKVRQNLHYRFGTTGSNAREYRQAHIPLLLHQHPTDVLFMGLGTGLTAGGAILHQAVERIVAVELIPEVVEAARILSDYNYNVVEDPNVIIRIDDARHHLLASTQEYDVIVSDLFVPWESESGYLYTVEHYRVAASRLKSGGLFCQWLPLYQVGKREFELIANSFASVFSHTTIWWGQLETTSPVIALIGTHSPISFDTQRIAARLRNLQQNVNTTDPTIGTPERLFDLYIGDWNLQISAKLNTDEHPRVEFLTPISNRDQRMIRGERLQRYYEQVFAKTQTENVKVSGKVAKADALQRRARQCAILFGK